MEAFSPTRSEDRLSADPDDPGFIYDLQLRRYVFVGLWLALH